MYSKLLSNRKPAGENKVVNYNQNVHLLGTIYSHIRMSTILKNKIKPKNYGNSWNRMEGEGKKLNFVNMFSSKDDAYKKKKGNKTFTKILTAFWQCDYQCNGVLPLGNSKYAIT